MSVGDNVACYVGNNQIGFCASDSDSDSDSEVEVTVEVTVEKILLMNRGVRWVLDLDWKRAAGLPSVILLAMLLWVYPLGNLLGSEMSLGSYILLWAGVSIPLLLRRGRDQLAIELAESEGSEGIMIVETRDSKATATLLNCLS